VIQRVSSKIFCLLNAPTSSTDSISVPQQLLDLFPIDDVHSKSTEGSQNALDIMDRAKHVQHSMIWRKPIPIEDDVQAEGVNRPGSLYKSYRTIDDLPVNARALYEKAAESSGISFNMLVRATYSIECQLQACIVAEKRQRLVEENMLHTQDED